MTRDLQGLAGAGNPLERTKLLALGPERSRVRVVIHGAILAWSRSTPFQVLFFSVQGAVVDRPRDLVVEAEAEPEFTDERYCDAIIGIRWDRWFSEDLVVPADRAAEINLRFTRSSESLKIRTRLWAADEEAKGEAVLRAFVSPTYAPIDDLCVFEAMARVLGGRLHELRFVRLDVTDESSQYAVVSVEDIDLGIAKPDRHRNGFLIANSETGSRSLTLLVWIWRLVYTNGMVAPVSHIFRMVHRRRKDGLIEEKLSRAIQLLPEHWRRTETTLRSARQDVVPDPRATLEALVTNHPQLRPIGESVRVAYEQEPEPNRFGIVQAITRAAQGLRPEDRLAVEELAGLLAARSPRLEASP